MGQHKTNPTAILAKQGRIPPKEKSRRFTNDELVAFAMEKVLGKGFIACTSGKPRKVRSDVFTEDELLMLMSNPESLKNGNRSSMSEEEQLSRLREYDEERRKFLEKYKNKEVLNEKFDSTDFKDLPKG